MDYIWIAYGLHMELWITYGMCVINNFFSYGLGHSALQSAAACEVRRGSCNQMGFMFKANWFVRLSNWVPI